ncbi:MAG: head decoration protein [Thiobacillus sp.]|nr:head decoration protein [Thiobacillus sp.]
MALTETLHAGEFIVSEANGTRSREEVTVAAAAAALPAGQVLGKITASGLYVAYSNVAVDGSEVAAAILYAPLADSAADQKAAVIVRDAEVDESLLTGLDATGIADLAALGIVMR